MTINNIINNMDTNNNSNINNGNLGKDNYNCNGIMTFEFSCLM